MTDSYSGGCQCGAVRFRVEGALGTPSICHCRMCQKAFGAYYAPLVSVGTAGFAWSRGRPKYFASSNHVKRGFCENCGTPLTFEDPTGMGLALGAFDEPARLPPAVQFGSESKIGFVDHLPELPNHATLEDVDEAPYLADIVNYQHPDHDTTDWTPIVPREPDHWRPSEQGV